MNVVTVAKAPETRMRVSPLRFGPSKAFGKKCCYAGRIICAESSEELLAYIDDADIIMRKVS